MSNSGTPTVVTLTVATFGVALSCCVACSSPLATNPAEEFELLQDDALVPTATCLVLESGQADKMLVTTGPIGREQRLPDDIEFTKVVGDSPVGWSFYETAVFGEGNDLNSGIHLGWYDDHAMKFETTPLPFSPDGASDFALGVLVDVPADTDLNPEMMFEMTGIDYTTGGESYTWNLTLKAFLTRSFDDPRACARFDSLDDSLNEQPLDGEA